MTATAPFGTTFRVWKSKIVEEISFEGHSNYKMASSWSRLRSLLRVLWRVSASCLQVTTSRKQWRNCCPLMMYRKKLMEWFKLSKVTTVIQVVPEFTVFVSPAERNRNEKADNKYISGASLIFNPLHLSLNWKKFTFPVESSNTTEIIWIIPTFVCEVETKWQSTKYKHCWHKKKHGYNSVHCIPISSLKSVAFVQFVANGHVADNDYQRRNESVEQQIQPRNHPSVESVFLLCHTFLKGSIWAVYHFIEKKNMSI